jgi:HK97 family phage portal protein
MKLFDRVLARMGYLPLLRKDSYQVGTTLTTTDAMLPKLFGYNPTIAGPNVTSDTALRQITVLTCCRVISETLSSLPGAVFEEGKSGSLQKVDHDLGAVLFESPNADMDRVEFIETFGVNVGLQGNWYNLKNKNGAGGVSSLYPIASDAMEVKRSNTGIITYRFLDRGQWENLPSDQIWHVKGFGGNGITGLSPIGYMRQQIGMALATEEWQARFFANGATPSFFVSMPVWLTPDQRKIARENLQNAFGGPENAYKAQLFEGGITATAATMPLQDAQFLELKQASREEIFGFYRVPPHMGGDLRRSTNNNIEQQALEWVMYGVMPYITRLEASISRHLFKPSERRRFRVKFNVAGLLRADAAARAALYSQMLQNGAMTRNEVRALEDWNRSDMPGMDDFTVQTALTPIDVLRKIAENNAKPKPPSAVVPPGGKGLLSDYGQGQIHITNLIKAPDQSITVLPADVTFDPQITINPAAQPAMDLDPLGKALERFAEVGERIAGTMDMDTELLRDKDGNALGTRKVPRKADK